MGSSLRGLTGGHHQLIDPAVKARSHDEPDPKTRKFLPSVLRLRCDDGHFSFWSADTTPLDSWHLLFSWTFASLYVPVSSGSFSDHRLQIGENDKSQKGCEEKQKGDYGRILEALCGAKMDMFTVRLKDRPAYASTPPDAVPHI